MTVLIILSIAAAFVLGFTIMYYTGKNFQKIIEEPKYDMLATEQRFDKR